MTDDTSSYYSKTDIRTSGPNHFDLNPVGALRTFKEILWDVCIVQQDMATNTNHMNDTLWEKINI